MSNGNSSLKKATAMDEVEELLRSAQDDILLNLSLNSHAVHSGTSSSYSQTSIGTIDLDLERRFEALKSNSKSKIESEGNKKKNPENFVDNIDESNNLFERFAALKNSIPSYSSSSAAATVSPCVVDVGKEIITGKEYKSDDEEDEVEKIINWAIDAARLDLSYPSDDDDDTVVSENDSDDEDDHRVDSKSK